MEKPKKRAKSRLSTYEYERLLAEARASVRVPSDSEFILQNHIQDLRKGKYLSQTELARRVGVSKSSVSMWENRVKGVKDKHKLALCHALGCSITMLFDWEV